MPVDGLKRGLVCWNVLAWLTELELALLLVLLLLLLLLVPLALRWGPREPAV